MSREKIRWRLLAATVLVAAVLLGCRNDMLSFMRKAVEYATTPPSIAAVYPTDGATDIPINLKTISVTFSKPVLAKSVTSSTFPVERKADSAPVAGKYEVSNDTITFSPSSELSYGTPYRLSLTTGIQDSDGNPLSETYSWSFTTGMAPDTTPPAGVSVEINGGAQWTASRSVQLTIQAVDDRGVAQMNVSNTNSFSEANWTTYQEAYQWQLPAGEGQREVFVKFRDASGNTSNVISPVQPIGVDLTAPEAIYLLLAGGRTSASSKDVEVNFAGFDTDNGAGASGASGYQIRYQAAAWPSGWQSFSTGSPSETFTEDVSQHIGIGETLTVEVRIQDAAGNVSAPLSSQITWDRTPPEVITTQPASGETGIPSNAGVVRVTFSEEMDPASFTASTFFIRQGTTTLPSTAVYHEGEATAELSGISLAQNTDYTVTVKSSVTDVAGNALGADRNWYFRTSDAIDTTPPEGTVGLSTGSTATATTAVVLAIDAADDYNAVYGMKIWGDNDPASGLPSFEQDAAWEPYATSKSWTLPAGSGYKYLFYKFMDSAANETATPQRLRISLDQVDPVISDLIINEGSGYTNDPDGQVTLSIVASDEHSGIEEMQISNDGVFDSEPVEPWTPLRSGWQLPTGEGARNVWVKVFDYVGRSAVFGPKSVVVDQSDPEVSFSEADVLEVNAPAIQTGTLTDAVSGIASYLWSQESGPGTIAFSDATAASPEVSTLVEGLYELKVTVTDFAGNSAFGTVPFTWDQTAPDNPPVLTVSQYSTTSQPTWSWDPVGGADYYLVSFDAGFTSPAATDLTSYSPAGSLTEGSHTLWVKALDNATNKTAASSAATFVDTVAPAISNDGQLFLTNVPLLIDYGAAPPDGDGQIIEGGSGLASLLWEQAGGPGTIQFTGADTETPTLRATADGEYELRLTVTDKAGNLTAAYFPFVWDTTAPAAPSVTGIAATPSTTPTWTWTSGGGGAGLYQLSWDRAVWFTAPDPADTSYKPGTPLGEGVHTLYVEERDQAGNWSPSGSFATTIDFALRSAPVVTRIGPYLRKATAVTWEISSGLGFADTADHYRYWVDDASHNPATAVETDANSITLSLPHGVHTLYVEEYDSSLVKWEGKYGTSSVEVDTVAPNAPLVAGASPTRDTTPAWSWTSGGGGGSGWYIYQLDGGGWSVETTQTGFIPPAALSEGDHTLEVQERDLAGNWSVSGSHTIKVDVTPPVVSAFTITPNGENGYASDPAVSLSISGTGTPTQMQFYEDGAYSGWFTYSTTHDWTLGGADGSQAVWVRLRDQAGNLSSWVSDSIVLDTTPPSITSFSINAAATTTTSYAVTLNSDVSGASYMRMKNGAGAYGAWYTYSTARSWNTTSRYGTKKVTVQYKDLAGNLSAETPDAIFYGTPSIYKTTKGSTSTGSITVDLTSYPSESGTNTFYLYSATSPTGAKTSRASTTGSSYTLSLSPGTFYYLFVRVYNADVGWGDYSSYAVGYSSAVTVVYNSADGADTALASSIKTLLEDTDFQTTYSTWVSGTMPNYWTVTLVPESEVSPYFTTGDDRYIIYGDPVIVTPATSLYSNVNRTHNIVHRGTSPTTVSYRSGVVAMGYGGARLLDTAETYWSTWGYADQGPVDIGYGESASFTDGTVYMYQWTSGNSVWRYPLASTVFVGGTTPTHNALVQISYAALGGRYSVYRADDSHPTGGAVYGRDYYSTNPHYFPVVRQGRFLQFGFPTLPDRPYTGKVYFINLIAVMDNY